MREQLRELPTDSIYRKHLELCLKFVNGELLDGHKIYSLHEPDVLCICKGKEHKKYEFGNKVSIVRLWNGIIIGAMRLLFWPFHKFVFTLFPEIEWQNTLCYACVGSQMAIYTPEHSLYMKL